MHKRITWMVVVIALFVLFGGLSFGVGLYFDYLWFAELGKTAVFTTVLYAKSMLGSGTLLAAFLFLYFNLLFANRGPGQIEIGIPTPNGQITAYRVEPETVRRFAGLASLAIGFLIGVGYAANWERVWRWLHRVDFGSADPVFGRDVSFYFFTLPFLRDVVRFGLMLSFLALIGVAVLYYFKGALTWGQLKGSGGRSRPSVHISLLAALVFALLGASAYLDRFELLYGTHNVFSGAGYADLHARLPMLSLLAAAALVGALLWIANAFLKGSRPAVIAILLYLVVMFGGNLYPAFIQKFFVDPNELDKESPQIAHNIRATLEAYNLDAVEERDLSGDTALTARDIENNSATIQSIRLWDHEPLLDALKQIQEIRTYYDFVSVDNDRYLIDGQLKQLMLSARELNSASLPERNWINEHLSYTHGYGIAVGPVNRMTSEGLPVLHVQNIPPESAYPLLEVDRPEIYYGELTHSYALVHTGQEEFDYPSGEENVYARYQGEGGVRVHSLLRKLLFAFYFRDPNILLSPLVTRDSRFLYFRDIRQRINRLAPFLMLDQDPYSVISGGKLFWIQDAYTVSDRYPYSTRTPGVGNYIRNSVKVVVDAYNGDVDLYVADAEDPVIRVYEKIFAGVFRPLSEIPEHLHRHLRYPEDIFTVQTYMYSVYHMGAPQIFYNKEDLWQIPTLATGSTENPMSPYYTIMRLPQETREEFILMLPFTPGRKDNLSAWMVARSDGEHYGKLVVYRFPKQKLVYGPRQIVARVNQDAEIARQISLWDQRGSQVIQGNLLIIPIEEALLYIRPLYLRAQNGKIPELKRVIVAYENRIAMEETLEASIARIFEGEYSFAAGEARLAEQSAGAPPRAPTAGLGLVEEAGEAYSRAVAAQRQGDWATYGEELRKLGAALEELKRARDSRPAPEP
ncbi:MAG: UPF0182 family protein [Acidobacteria bacterium]|nr:UPF0182 family protein [Acidobacteriota bacterium]